MPRVVIDPGDAPVSDEALEHLRATLQRELGEEYDVRVTGWWGERELREGTEFIPIIELFFTGVAAADVLARAVRAWRTGGTAPPRRLTRIRAWEYDENENLRRVWTEETEEDG